MKDGVILINTARGDLIDTAALIEAIESQKVGAAALDVLEQESGLYYADLKTVPIPNHDLAILKSFPNVIVTPHTAFYTERPWSIWWPARSRACWPVNRGARTPIWCRGERSLRHSFGAAVRPPFCRIMSPGPSAGGLLFPTNWGMIQFAKERLQRRFGYAGRICPK